MPKSPFELCFDHVEDCRECSYATRKLCPTGKALFDAAHEACKRLAGMDLHTRGEA